MFRRRVRVEAVARDAPQDAATILCQLHWLDNFAMRNFTNDAIFDDTLPVEDGLLEIGSRVPLKRLQTAMEDWFRRKSYLQSKECLRITEL